MARVSEFVGSGMLFDSAIHSSMCFNNWLWVMLIDSLEFVVMMLIKIFFI